MPRSSKHKKVLSSIDESVKLYEQKRALFSAFTDKLKALLGDLLHDADVKYHVIESRTKEVQSFREKATRANKRYTKPLEEITDLCGLRLIVYYLDDVEAACRLIERKFSIDENSSLDKGDLLKPNEFGYRSVHFIVSLPITRSGLAEWRSFAGLTAEIQVRTVLQHAWASISHTLDYKREAEVPAPLRRKLSRLAGLLELSDEEFSDLRLKEREFSGNVVLELARGETDIQLDAVSLAGYLAESKLIRFLKQAAEVAGFELLHDDDDYNGRSGLIGMCLDVGIKTIGELDVELERSRPWVKDYLKQQRLACPTTWSSGDAFLAQLVLIRQHIETLTVQNLRGKGWDESSAMRVTTIARMRL